MDGLFEEPEGAEIVHGGEGGFDVAEGGEDDGGDLNAFEGEAAEEFKAVHAGHFEIGDEDGDGVGEELIEGFLAVGGGVGGEAPTADDGGEAGTLGFFVVGDEDAGDGERRGDGHKGADSIANGVPMVGCTLSSMVANGVMMGHLNELLRVVLTIQAQSLIHGELEAKAGFRRLGEVTRGRYLRAGTQARWLVEAVETPSVGESIRLRIGREVREQLANDLALSRELVTVLNREATEAVSGFLAEEESHVDWLEAQLYLIQEIGTEAFLSQQG